MASPDLPEARERVMMTPEQLELARHALGLTNGRRVSYRNHFVSSDEGPDFVTWTAMVAAGYARTRKGSQLTGGDPLFWLTREGAEAALRGNERLDPEDLPPDRAP